MMDVHKGIFGETDNFACKMKRKPRLMVIIAMREAKVIGYKAGYEMDKDKFYSWLGGVDAVYRNRGIASALMEKQHEYLKQSGYHIVQTKTKNKWRNMLLLNIKHGFEAVETYYNERGVHKIVLEKKLVN
ncbi:GNAT family N-acetyltransferase [Alkalicoccus halolimnae]|uniref:GNAT family N-acetyltransferase n=1 Tax=Alkalicoccus halolimnae TaxID=1667239 RepID=A0A5C7F5L2_9BACI|nr:GNAT family N-acetyltransferase [Alkalicoccus halolimnae]TXF85343.1 GNAT family N-acetyltransferase [Alkalicoccus halolimnae]